MAQLQFRPWQDGDDVTLLQLWGDPEGEQVPWYRSAFDLDSDGGTGLGSSGLGSRGAGFKRTIVATDQGIPVAAGVVWEQQVHPTRLSAYVEVARDHRRTGLGSELVVRLRAAAAASPSAVTELTCKVDAGTVGEVFATTLGLREVQRSEMVEVAAAKLVLPRFPVPEGASEQDAGADVVQDLATGSVELTAAVGAWYQSVHAGWSPSIPMTPGVTQNYLLAEATGAQGAIVLRARPQSAFGGTVTPTKKGKIQAFGVSYGSYAGDRHAASWAAQDAAADVLLGWDPELSAEDAEAAVRDLLALLAYQHPVVVEVDSSMEPLQQVLKPLFDAGSAVRVSAETVILAG